MVGRHEAKPHCVDSAEALALKDLQDIESDTPSTRDDEGEEVSVEFSTQESTGREAFLSSNGDVEAGLHRKGYWNGNGQSRRSSSMHNHGHSHLANGHSNLANGHATEDSGVEMPTRVTMIDKIHGATVADNYQEDYGANGHANGNSGGCTSGHSHDHDHGHSLDHDHGHFHDHDNHHGYAREHGHRAGGKSMNIWAVLVHTISDAISSGVICAQGAVCSRLMLGVFEAPMVLLIIWH